MIRNPSLGLNRLAFPLAAALSVAILADLYRQGRTPMDLVIYGVILGIILREYARE